MTLRNPDKLHLLLLHKNLGIKHLLAKLILKLGSKKMPRETF
jgi:hypothetical protein